MLYKHKHIGRFSNLHKCTFNVDLDYNVKSDKVIRMRCKVVNVGKQVVNVSDRSSTGNNKYITKIIEGTLIGKELKRLCTDDKKILFVKFNNAYLLAKKELPFSKVYLLVDFLELQKKNDAQNLGKAYLTERKCAEFTEYIIETIKSKFARDLTSCNYPYLNV